MEAPIHTENTANPQFVLTKGEGFSRTLEVLIRVNEKLQLRAKFVAQAAHVGVPEFSFSALMNHSTCNCRVVFLMTGNMSLTHRLSLAQLRVLRLRAEPELLGAGHGGHRLQVPQADQEGRRRLRRRRREPLHARRRGRLHALLPLQPRLGPL